MRREAGEAPTFNGVSVLQKFLFSHAVKLLSGCLSEKKPSNGKLAAFKSLHATLTNDRKKRVAGILK